MGLQPDTTSRYIAFLRAINVGGHTVKMDHLRRLFEELGHSSVETFIASGNVIFEAPMEDTRALESRIEGHLRNALGYDVATFIRSPSELADIASYQPLAASEPDAAGHPLYIAFAAAPPSHEAQQRLMAHRNEIDDFHIHGRAIYWSCRKKISESAFSGALLEKIIKMPATMRNSTTVRKLAAKYPAVQGAPERS